MWPGPPHRHPGEDTADQPTLHGDFYGGFYTPSDSTGDIHKFTRRLADTCVRRSGRFLFDTKGIGIAISTTTATGQDRLQLSALVVCASIASRKFAAMLGDRINV